MATVEQITALIVPRLGQAEVRALAEDWRAMGAGPRIDDDTAAHGYVSNFVNAMDNPDED